MTKHVSTWTVEIYLFPDELSHISPMRKNSVSSLCLNSPHFAVRTDLHMREHASLWAGHAFAWHSLLQYLAVLHLEHTKGLPVAPHSPQATRILWLSVWNLQKPQHWRRASNLANWCKRLYICTAPGSTLGRLAFCLAEPPSLVRETSNLELLRDSFVRTEAARRGHHRVDPLCCFKPLHDRD